MTKYPQDELGRYVGKTPDEYPDNLNYTKYNERREYGKGYGMVRSKKRKARTHPPSYLRKLMLALDKTEFRYWINVEVFVPTYGGKRGNWTKFGVPIWIDAIVAGKYDGKWKYGAVVIKKLNQEFDEQVEYLQEELDIRDIRLLILDRREDTTTMSFIVTRWMNQEVSYG